MENAVRRSNAEAENVEQDASLQNQDALEHENDDNESNDSADDESIVAASSQSASDDEDENLEYAKTVLQTLRGETDLSFLDMDDIGYLEQASTWSEPFFEELCKDARSNTSVEELILNVHRLSLPSLRPFLELLCYSTSLESLQVYDRGWDYVGHLTLQTNRELRLMMERVFLSATRNAQSAIKEVFIRSLECSFPSSIFVNLESFTNLRTLKLGDVERFRGEPTEEWQLRFYSPIELLPLELNKDQAWTLEQTIPLLKSLQTVVLHVRGPTAARVLSNLCLLPSLKSAEIQSDDWRQLSEGFRLSFTCRHLERLALVGKANTLKVWIREPSSMPLRFLCRPAVSSLKEIHFENVHLSEVSLGQQRSTLHKMSIVSCTGIQPDFFSSIPGLKSLTAVQCDLTGPGAILAQMTRVLHAGSPALEHLHVELPYHNILWTIIYFTLSLHENTSLKTITFYGGAFRAMMQHATSGETFLVALLVVFFQNETLERIEGLSCGRSHLEVQLLMGAVQHMLKLNRYGRRLLKATDEPLGLWAEIIGRISKDREPSVLFHFLRQKPDLVQPKRNSRKRKAVA